MSTHDDFFVSSVNEAKRLVLANLSSGQTLTNIVAFITDPANDVRGSEENYSSIVNRLIEYDYSSLAFKTCAYALKIYPNSVGLLGDLLRAAAESGMVDDAKPYVDKALLIPKKYWTWDLYYFLCKYYVVCVKTCSIEEMDNFMKKAFDVVEAYISAMPLDDRAHNQKAQLLLEMGDTAAARKCLEDAIFTEHQVDGESVRVVAQTCCGTYLSLLEKTGEYKTIKRVARQAIANTAQTSPKHKVRYPALMLALAGEAEVSEEEYGNRDKILAVLNDYQCAYYLDSEGGYEKLIRDRYTLLCCKAKPPITDLPLRRHPPVEEM